MTHDVTELTVASINVCTHNFKYVAGMISLSTVAKLRK